MINNKFIIFHQPKTGGTYALKCLPNGYVLPHNKNYHYCLNNKFNFSNTKLVAIIRDPLDYYISLITFWCLDPKYCKCIANNSLDYLKKQYNLKNNNIGHPNFWMSKGYTERNLINILNNLFDQKFLENHKDKLSIKLHTYDYYIFNILLKLDIGFYTFSFLDQYSRKKVSEIKTPEECKEEIIYIKNNFIILNTKNITKELQELCKNNNVPFTFSPKQKVSNRKNIEEYNINKKLIEKIRYRDRFIFEIFKDLS